MISCNKLMWFLKTRMSIHTGLHIEMLCKMQSPFNSFTRKYLPKVVKKIFLLTFTSKIEPKNHSLNLLRFISQCLQSFLEKVKNGSRCHLVTLIFTHNCARAKERLTLTKVCFPHCNKHLRDQSFFPYMTPWKQAIKPLLLGRQIKTCCFTRWYQNREMCFFKGTFAKLVGF